MLDLFGRRHQSEQLLCGRMRREARGKRSRGRKWERSSWRGEGLETEGSEMGGIGEEDFGEEKKSCAVEHTFIVFKTRLLSKTRLYDAKQARKKQPNLPTGSSLQLGS